MSSIEKDKTVKKDVMEPKIDQGKMLNEMPRKRRRMKKILTDIREQVEFYFSDANLCKDAFLMSKTGKNGTNYLPIELVLSFNRMKKLHTTYKLVVRALKQSKHLEVNESTKMLRRINPFVPSLNTDHCTIYIENLPCDITMDWVKTICSKVGPVAYISLPKLKNGKHKGFAFIEYAREEDAFRACSILNSPPKNFFRCLTRPPTQLQIFKQERVLKSIALARKRIGLRNQPRARTRSRVLHKRDHDKLKPLLKNLVLEETAKRPLAKSTGKHEATSARTRSNSKKNLPAKAGKSLKSSPTSCSEKRSKSSPSDKRPATPLPSDKKLTSSSSSKRPTSSPSAPKGGQSENHVDDVFKRPFAKRKRRHNGNSPSTKQDSPQPAAKFVKHENSSENEAEAKLNHVTNNQVIDDVVDGKLTNNEQVVAMSDASELVRQQRLLVESIQSVTVTNHRDASDGDDDKCNESEHRDATAKVSEAVHDCENLVEKKLSSAVVAVVEDRSKKRRRRRRIFRPIRPDLLPPPQLRVMSKVDWKEFRRQYLHQQREEMGKLKSIMQDNHLHRSNSTSGFIKHHLALNTCADEDSLANFDAESLIEFTADEMESPPTDETARPAADAKPSAPSFTPGVLVEIESFKSSLNHAIPINQSLPDFGQLKSHFFVYGEVCYVDVKPGSSKGVLRFKSSDSAQKAILEERKFALRLLIGEEEESYWDSLLLSRQQKRSKERLKVRGRDKLTARAQHRIDQHRKRHIKFDCDF